MEAGEAVGDGHGGGVKEAHGQRVPHRAAGARAAKRDEAEGRGAARVGAELRPRRGDRRVEERPAGAAARAGDDGGDAVLGDGEERFVKRE